MAFDYSKLRGRIVEKFGTMTKFSECIGIAKQTVSAKLNGNIDITRCDIVNWAKVLDIDKSEIGTYFFKEKL